MFPVDLPPAVASNLFPSLWLKFVEFRYTQKALGSGLYRSGRVNLFFLHQDVGNFEAAAALTMFKAWDFSHLLLVTTFLNVDKREYSTSEANS